jgi:hypothetical protein
VAVDQPRAALTAAAAAFVAAMDRVDTLLDELTYPTQTLSASLRRAWWQAQGWQPSGWRPPRVAVAPPAFIEHALPFAAPAWMHEEPASVERLDAHLVIGANFRQYPAPTADLLHDLDEASRCDAFGAAEYVHLGSLPLWVAREGKNRVNAYRQLGRPVTARVFQSIYPDSARLALRAVRGSHAVFLVHRNPLPVQCNGDEEVIPAGSRVLAFPKSTVPLLEQYGVQWAPALPPSWAGPAVSEIRVIRAKLSRSICIP